MKSLSVVMYHYVRDLPRTRYPGIRGLTTDAFRKQLGRFRKTHTFVTVEECLHGMKHPADFPDNGVLLTFDDGYADHYLNVFPLLDEVGVQGVFFPPAKPVTDHCVLDVNKIHFTLAAAPDVDSLLRRLFELLDARRREGGEPALLASNQELYSRYAAASNRFDSREVGFVKRLLQRELPTGLRARLTDELFRHFVTRDEAAFASELYMNSDQLRCLIRHGMAVGSHGHGHFWMNTLNRDEQATELDASLKFLRALGVSTRQWLMCFPYGAYDDTTLALLRERDCGMGFTSVPRKALLEPANALTLERFDTNDFENACEQNPH